jgi:Nickel responsive protein SCO4226-like
MADRIFGGRTLPFESPVNAGASRTIHSYAKMCARKGLPVPKFVIEREIPGAGNLSDSQLREVSQKSVAALQEMGTKIQWLHSYVTGDKVYCVYLAPDEETIREHARLVGLPANRISAVRRLLDPTSAE